MHGDAFILGMYAKCQSLDNNCYGKYKRIISKFLQPPFEMFPLSFDWFADTETQGICLIPIEKYSLINDLPAHNNLLGLQFANFLTMCKCIKFFSGL